MGELSEVEKLQAAARIVRVEDGDDVEVFVAERKDVTLETVLRDSMLLKYMLANELSLKSLAQSYAPGDIGWPKGYQEWLDENERKE